MLDLNLPEKDGREVLAEITHDSSLRLIPVIVLTTSHAEEDIVRAYGLHATAIPEPVGFDKFAEADRSIENFRMCVVMLPKTADSR